VSEPWAHTTFRVRAYSPNVVEEVEVTSQPFFLPCSPKCPEGVVCEGPT
jgi:hypothetical protein